MLALKNTMNGMCRSNARLLLFVFYFHKCMEVQNLNPQKFMTFSFCVLSNVSASTFIRWMLFCWSWWNDREGNFMYTQLNTSVLFELKLSRRTVYFLFTLSLISLLLSVRCCIWKLMKVKITISCVYKELVFNLEEGEINTDSRLEGRPFISIIWVFKAISQPYILFWKKKVFPIISQGF